MKPNLFIPIAAALALPVALPASEPPSVSGIYPNLAMFNHEGECGTGAVVPWADRLWVVTYAPHKPNGSSDKLYEITPGLQQIIRPESIGGTPANRMIHRESNQLFIGPYAIAADRTVRAIPYTDLFGRLTGMARHLTDPAHKILCATMEEGIYEIDVKSLAVTELWADEQRKAGRHSDLPGYHGKGFYSAQGRYVYANNGDHVAAALTDPAVPSGVLAEWDGMADHWDVVRRNQFTDVTGPGGIEGNAPGDDRVWSIGWDNRSLILMLLDQGVWHSYRLPKTSHCYDGAHGWNTEWPRIREIGEDPLLMTMHGSFWKFPKSFSTANSAGIAPRSTYLKVVGDFCRWGDRIVLGCDDTAQNEFLNADRIKGKSASPGQSQSNLWFVDAARLDACGPALGRGAVWLDDDVISNTPGEAYLFSGFAKRSLYVAHGSAEPVTFTLEVDQRGDGSWRKLRDIAVPANSGKWMEFTAAETGAWVRLTSNRDAEHVTAFFHYRAADPRGTRPAAIFNGLAGLTEEKTHGGVLHARGGDFKTLRFIVRDAAGDAGCYDLDGDLHLRKADDPAGAKWTATNAAIPPPVITADAASALYVDGKGRRWRLPLGDAAFARSGVLGDARTSREVSTERNLLNIQGTFYEVPAENAGGFIKLRPVASHSLRIHDFASYRGLLVMSGVADDARGEHIIRSDDNRCALWVGAVDDLWSLGKPRGHGGPWHDTATQTGVPSDPYLATGYDRKVLTVSHDGREPVTIRVEADFTGTGTWAAAATFTVPPGKPLEYAFPDGFGAYWLRLVADRVATVTGTFSYD